MVVKSRPHKCKLTFTLSPWCYVQNNLMELCMVCSAYLHQSRDNPMPVNWTPPWFAWCYWLHIPSPPSPHSMFPLNISLGMLPGFILWKAFGFGSKQQNIYPPFVLDLFLGLEGGQGDMFKWGGLWVAAEPLMKNFNSEKYREFFSSWKPQFLKKSQPKFVAISEAQTKAPPTEIWDKFKPLTFWTVRTRISSFSNLNCSRWKCSIFF